MAFALPPVRSISLPTRLTPTSLRIEQELNNLRKWQTSQTLGAEAIELGLLGLAKLYTSVNGLVQSPASGPTLVRHQEDVEKVLEESIMFLDACSLGRDLVSAMNQQLQVLQSSFRRKGAESSNRGNLGAYLSFRKKAIKDVSKCIKAMKQTENKTSSSVQDQNYLVLVLKELRNITVNVLQSLMLFLSSPALKSKIGGCSFISKIGFLSSEKGKKDVSEIEIVDLAIYSLHHQQAKNKDLEMVRKKMEALSRCMEGLETGLDAVYKCLIRYRVSLLNVLNH